MSRFGSIGMKRWKQSSERWEDKRALEDNSAEILQGLQQTPGGLGRAAPKKPTRMLDGGWNIGRSVDITAGATFSAENSVPLLEVKGDDKVAGPITVTLQSEIETNITLFEDMFATVQWGVGGFQVEAEIDFLNGTSFTVFASFIRLTGNVVGAGAGTETAKLGAFASYGAHPGGLHPQRTVKTDSDGVVIPVLAPAATSNPMIIPRFATGVQLTQNNAAAAGSADYSLLFQKIIGVGSPTARYFYTSATGGNEERKSGIPAMIPNTSRSMRITNEDGAISIASPRLLFNLGL